MKTHYTQVKKELLIAIRGKKSQSYINKRLGYEYNYYSKWENNSKKLSWPDFVNLCEILNRKKCLANALTSLNLLKNGDCYDYVNIIRSLKGKRRLNEIAKITEISRFTISRWMKNESIPTFEEIFILIEKLSGDHIRFMSFIVDIDLSMPTLKREYEKYLIQRDIFYNHPLTSIINCYLHHDEYKKMPKHVVGHISNKFNIPIEEEKNILALLEKGGIIKMEKGRYQFCQNENNNANTAGDYYKGLLYKKFWLEKSLAIINDLIEKKRYSKESRFAYSFLSLSKSGYEQLQEKCRQFLSELSTSDDNGPYEKMIMLNLQLLDIEKAGEDKLLG